jgi:hypothetical protein
MPGDVKMYPLILFSVVNIIDTVREDKAYIKKYEEHSHA